MDIILIPGLWLDASSWDLIVPKLEDAGHRAHALTLPGMESKDADRSAVTRKDHVDAVVAVIDSLDGPVSVVGHSMGAGLAHAVVDARPDRVARVFYIGGFPSPDGSEAGFPSVNGEIPLLEWSEFDEADLVGLDESGLAEFRERSIPSPARATNDPQVLTDERRYDVPATMICPEFTADMVKGWIDDDLEPIQELTRIKDVTYVDLPTGHWPQFTKAQELADIILNAIR